mgnify:CR=1 FL=1
MEIVDIKFKAKRLDNGEWVEGDLMKESYGARIIEHTSKVDNWVAVDPSTVCQFTGEKDMNGNEIYIGDIISNLETGSIIEVTWNERLKGLNCKFLNADKGLEVPFGIFVSRYKRIVVVGNKFDNEK